MKPFTISQLLADQKDRIERNNLKEGENAVIDFIEEINEGSEKNH